MLAGALCSAVVPSVASGQVGEDSVVGEGFVAGDQFVVSVRSGPSGENPTGFIAARGVVSFEAVATCLRVSGNRASGGYRITSSPDRPIGSGFVAAVQDNGPLGSFPPDVLLPIGGYTAVPPVACPDPDALPPPPSPSAGLPFESGGVTVIDSRPFPTSKDQCKNGGWRNSGITFKNEGQCIAFVQRAPKRVVPPAGGVDP
jgi:hypothetical protein